MNKQRVILFVLLSAALWGLPRRAAAQIFAVRANALAVCSATLNVGAEAALTDNWSLELSGYWNPVNTISLSMNFSIAWNLPCSSSLTNVTALPVAAARAVRPIR